MTYTVRCYSCQYARAMGTAKINAQLTADKHGRAKPLHAVGVVEEKIIQLRVNTEPQLFRTDDVPF